jgi:hypothetical protein
MHPNLLAAMLSRLAIVICLSSCVRPDQKDVRSDPGKEIDGALGENHCERMQGWIAQHRGSLPSTYDDILRFPAECRKLLFNEQPPAVQSALWRTQLTRYREQHPALTAEQSAVLGRAIELLSPSVFAVPTGAPERSRADRQLRDLEQQAIKAFGVEETRALLAQLGPASPASLRAQFGPVDRQQ